MNPKDLTPAERLARQTGYSLEVCELMLEGEDENLFVRKVVEHKRLHVLAQRLWDRGWDPMTALETLYSEYEQGGLIRLERAYKRLEKEGVNGR